MDFFIVGGYQHIDSFIGQKRIMPEPISNYNLVSFYLAPNPDIENTMLAQVLNMPRKAIKSLITNRADYFMLQSFMKYSS